MNNTDTQLKTLQDLLDDIKATDVVTLDVSKQTSITDYMIICSGRSSRHVRSIAEHIAEHMKTSGIPALSKSGLNTGEWALIDFGYFIVHIMQPDTREFYNIEGLWQDK